MTEVDFPTIMS